MAALGRQRQGQRQAELAHQASQPKLLSKFLVNKRPSLKIQGGKHMRNDN